MGESSCGEGCFRGVAPGCAHALCIQNSSACSLSGCATTLARTVSASEANSFAAWAVVVGIKTIFAPGLRLSSKDNG